MSCQLLAEYAATVASALLLITPATNWDTLWRRAASRELSHPPYLLITCSDFNYPTTLACFLLNNKHAWFVFIKFIRYWTSSEAIKSQLTHVIACCKDVIALWMQLDFSGYRVS